MERRTWVVCLCCWLFIEKEFGISINIEHFAFGIILHHHCCIKHVFSYFPHVLPFPHLSFSLNEFNIAEWGLMTVRMHRNRVNVLNYSIISCLYIKEEQHTCRKNVSLMWTVILNYQSTVVLLFLLCCWYKTQSFLNSGKHRFCKKVKWWPFSPMLLRVIRISLVHFYCAGWWLHVFLTYLTEGVSSTISCKILSIYVLFI